MTTSRAIQKCALKIGTKFYETYEKFFKIPDFSKNYIPQSCCLKCRKIFSQSADEIRKIYHRIWREQRNNSHGCYFCSFNLNDWKKKNSSYRVVQSVEWKVCEGNNEDHIQVKTIEDLDAHNPQDHEFEEIMFQETSENALDVPDLGDLVQDIG
ncbi:hypothetical protein SNEBB_000695 [Seison nebaliae]|nr:hypothetical protein SNEBB_000695 [Seison nebaliae]